MSKSIYDEALNLIENIKRTLEQAQKQEKLLELYVDKKVF